jgi:hypothetical protein
MVAVEADLTRVAMHEGVLPSNLPDPGRQQELH